MNNLIIIDIPIIVDECTEFPDIRVTIYMSEMLSEEQEKSIERLTYDWYTIGVEKGYGEGVLHYMEELIFDDEATIFFILDMGSCRSFVLEDLLKRIKSKLSEFEVQIDKIEID